MRKYFYIDRITYGNVAKRMDPYLKVPFEDIQFDQMAQPKTVIIININWLIKIILLYQLCIFSYLNRYCSIL